MMDLDRRDACSVGLVETEHGLVGVLLGYHPLYAAVGAGDLGR